MAKKKINEKPLAINVLSEARQELYWLQESVQTMESSNGALEAGLDSMTGSLESLVGVIESLDATMGKCLTFAETWGSRMDDWEDRLASLEDKAEATQHRKPKKRKRM